MGVLYKNLQLLCSSRGRAPSSELDIGKMLLGAYLMSVYHRYVLQLCILGEVSTSIKYSGL
jgi:hypothetical protein